MKKISFWKKISLFNNYKRIIKNNAFELEQKFNVRIDKASRLYTVINVPENIIGEAYSLKKSDIDRIAERFTTEFSNELSTYLNNKGLRELCSFYDMRKVDKYSWLLVFGFSLFKSDIFYKNLYFRFIPIISTLVLALILFLIIR